MWRLVLYSAVATGCILTPDPVFAVRRSAVVPHRAPPMRTGHALDQQVRITGYAATDIVQVKPVETAGANAGLYVARHNLGGTIAVRLAEHTDLAFSGQASLEQGAMAVATDAAMRPHGNAIGFGGELAHAFPVNDQIQVGAILGAMHFQVPYYEVGTCIMNCTPGARHGRCAAVRGASAPDP